VTLGVGLAVIVAVGAFTLTHAPPRVVRVGEIGHVVAGTVNTGFQLCQANEVLPAGVSAIRLSVAAYYGSRLRLKAFSGGRVITEGSRGPDWTGTSVTVPVKPLSHTISPVRLCLYIGPNSEAIYFFATQTPAQESAVSGSGALLGNRLGVEYLASGHGSWWSRILTVARHMGIGHALNGTWVVLLIAALVGAVGILALRLVLRELP